MFGEKLSGMGDEELEEVEVGSGEVKGSVFDGGVTFGRVEEDVGEGNGVWRVVGVGGLLGRGEDGVDGWEELGGGGRFGKIVVGRDLEWDDG
ncbi:hypothetical protein, partial [Neisseria sicca]|uniref:hypothetical protein n=1 Tax=Neisseria sicca TaxID=490 RepID=UPI0011BD0EDF